MPYHVATHSDVWHETIYSLAFVVVLFEHSRRPLVHVFLNKNHAPRYSDVVFRSLIRNIETFVSKLLTFGNKNKDLFCISLTYS